MAHVWPAESVLERVDLFLDEDQVCREWGRNLHVCSHRERRVFTLQGPRRLLMRIGHGPDPACPARHHTISPAAELRIALPRLAIAWDVFAWIGLRRFGRHWSVPQICAELADTYRIDLSEDAIEDYVRRYATMVAARHMDLERLREEYAGVTGLVLSIDGLQPEKGHETLYVVRELTQRRVWFAEPRLSSTHDEVRRVLARTRGIAEALGIPVSGWISDKQEAFVQGIAAEFPGTPHAYCDNHFLRDLAKPMLERDSHAKVKMRQKVRGLRAIEKAVLEDAAAAKLDTHELDETREVQFAPPSPSALCPTAFSFSAPSNATSSSPPQPSPDGQVVLEYCAAVRGILNDDQGGPLDPPGLRPVSAWLPR